MPHVSKHPLSRKVQEDIAVRLEHFLVESGPQQRKNIFSEIITTTERTMIAKRLAMILLIQNDASINAISRALKVSPSTAGRFYNAYHRGKYKHTAKWLRKEAARKYAIGLLSDIASIPFNAKKDTLSGWLQKF